MFLEIRCYDAIKVAERDSSVLFQYVKDQRAERRAKLACAMLRRGRAYVKSIRKSVLPEKAVELFPSAKLREKKSPAKGLAGLVAKW